ncbi:MAG: ankyrin [Acidobacteria bacterium OLB17]|nr:MAG: ankyrin [Acidobacteria bacterium OLB17]MCZ2390729.1 ankyrin repeat domain-containing protein [Acidobacteriota bacterium]
MEKAELLDRIARGRTDLVFELLNRPDWNTLLNDGEVKPLQWFVYYNDTTAIKAVMTAGGGLSSIDIDRELGNASFFGHWKVVDFLISQGADINWSVPETGESPLHSALCKAGRPHFLYVVKLLVENGANINAKTIPDRPSGAFMRDVRTKGETPLHRAAAYADETMIRYMLDHGADKQARDAHGNSPLSWASEHLRPGSILHLLSFEGQTVSEETRSLITSDHGSGWGNGMERKFVGDYLPESFEGTYES